MHTEKKAHQMTGPKPVNLPLQTAIAIRKLVVAEVLSLHRLSVRRRINAVTPSRRTDMRAMNRRTERNHVLMDHATEDRIAAYNPCQ